MSVNAVRVDRAAQIRHLVALDAAPLFASAETRALVEIGLDATAEVTARYGAPAAPRWASGTVETDVFMSYHNGGPDGHTSVGPLGDGVPRNVLLIANAVNTVARREVISAGLRAAAFTAACLHDHTQLCGRALAPEGRGEGRGDERISAETARARCLDAGISAEVASLVAEGVMATAFDPEAKTQAVWQAYAADDQEVIVRELVAAADLLSLTSRRGPLGSLEMVAEGLCLGSAGRLAQARLAARRPRDLGEFYTAAGLDAELHAAVIAALHGQSKFFSGFVFQDSHLRELAGAGIDDLFPGRGHNAAVLAAWAEELTDRTATPAQVWEQIRAEAGYPAPAEDDSDDDDEYEEF